MFHVDVDVACFPLLTLLSLKSPKIPIEILLSRGASFASATRLLASQDLFLFVVILCLLVLPDCDYRTRAMSVESCPEYRDSHHRIVGVVLCIYTACCSSEYGDVVTGQA